MPSVLFTLRVPAEAVYRPLAAEVAGRFAEISGGSAEAVVAFAAEVAQTADSLAAGATDLDLTFSRGASSVEVAMTNGAEIRRCTAPL